MNKIPIFEVVFDEESNLNLISFVDKPANNINFIKLNNKSLKLFDSSKKEVVGCVLPADTPIYYFDPSIGECYLKFSSDTIEKIALSYFADNKYNFIDYNHNREIDVSSVVLIETYFTKKDNEIFDNLKKGSWIVRYKILNEELYNKIKDEEINGLSIDGKFFLKKINDVNMNKKTISMKVKEYLKNLLLENNSKNEIKFIYVKEFGENYRMFKIIESLNVGNSIYVIGEDKTEFKLDDGKYIIEYDGKIYEISVTDGIISEIVEIKKEELNFDSKNILVDNEDKEVKMNNDEENEDKSDVVDDENKNDVEVVEEKEKEFFVDDIYKEILISIVNELENIKNEINKIKNDIENTKIEYEKKYNELSFLKENTEKIKMSIFNRDVLKNDKNENKNISKNNFKIY